MNQATELPCPQCKKVITWTEDYPERPFCSKRCQLIDLGEWADESYRIPVKSSAIEDDLDYEV